MKYGTHMLVNSLPQCHLITHPLSFSADRVADDVCPIRCARRREDGGLPVDL